MTTLAVPSAYATITAAIAAIPATVDAQYDIDIDADTQWAYTESAVTLTKTASSTNYVRIRSTATREAMSVGGTWTVSSVYTQIINIGFDDGSTILVLSGANCTVERCVFNGTGTVTGSGADQVWRNNYFEVKQNPATGGPMLFSANGIKFLNNLVFSNTADATRQNIEVATGVQNFEMQNCQFYSMSDTNQIFVNFADENPTGLVFDYCTYGHGTATAEGAAYYIAKFNATTYATPAALNAAKSTLA